ncbi:MAG: chemotaxis protein CheC, partial [Gaiellales bacterium]
AGDQLCELLGTRLDGEMGRSALREVGNIPASSYLNAIVEMTGMELEPSRRPARWARWDRWSSAASRAPPGPPTRPR